jgi:hypothetical protein
MAPLLDSIYDDAATLILAWLLSSRAKIKTLKSQDKNAQEPR